MATTRSAATRLHPEAGLHYRGQHSLEPRRPVHPGCVDDQESADAPGWPAHRRRASAHLHDGSDIPEFGLKFPFSEKLAPRLGAAYDLKGDGRTKLFSSWGIFYDIFKLELPRGSFGGDKWLEYHYTLDTPDWTTLVSNAAAARPPAPARIIRGAPTAANPVGGIDFRHPSFGCGRDRSRPQADAGAGSDGRNRAPAQQLPRPERSLRPQAGRSARLRTPGRSRRTAMRSTLSPTRAKARRHSRSPTRT